MRSQRVSSAATRTQHSSSFISSISSGRMEDLACSRLREREGRERERGGEKEKGGRGREVQREREGEREGERGRERDQM